MATEKTPAIVVGFERNGLGVSRALAAAGIPSIGIGGPERLPDWKTACCEIRACRRWTQEGLLDEIRRVAQEHKSRLPVLITKDQAVLWLSRERTSLCDNFIIELPEPDVVELLMSKRRTDRLAQTLNLPMPASWFVTSESELAQAATQLTYPAILKPQVKNDQFRRFGLRKAYRIENADQLNSAYIEVAQWESEVIVQEWVQGPDANVAFCLSYVGSEGSVFYPGRKLIQYPIRCGNTAICEPAPDNWEAEIKSITKRLWSAAEYRGLGSVELKFDEIRKRFFIMEPTVGRTNYQNEIAVINGMNIPAIAYFGALGDWEAVSRLAAVPLNRPRRKLIDESVVFRAILDARSIGDLTMSGGLQLLKGRKKFMLFRLGDPAPFFASFASWIWSRSRGAVRRLFRLVGLR